MQKFVDRTGAEWPVEIDLPMRQKLIETIGVDILDPKQLPELFKSLPRVLDVLACVCGDAIAKHELKPIDFFGRLHGHFLEAKAALVEELRFFFQSYGEAATASVLELAIDQEKQMTAVQIDAVRNTAKTKLPVFMAKAGKKAEAAIDRALKELDDDQPDEPT